MEMLAAKAKYVACACIVKAHNINKAIPHGYGTYGAAYKVPYGIKMRLINKAIRLIKKYGLNIKYGKHESVTYFEWRFKTHKGKYVRRQFSFHGKYETEKTTPIRWIGVEQPPTKINGRIWVDRYEDQYACHGAMKILKLRRKP